MLIFMLNVIMVTIAAILILVLRKAMGCRIQPWLLTVMWVLFFLCALFPISLLRGISLPETGSAVRCEAVSAAVEEPMRRFSISPRPTGATLVRSYLRRYGVPLYWIGVGMSLAYYFFRVMLTQIWLKRDQASRLTESERLSYAALKENSMLPVRVTEHSGPMVAGIPPRIYIPRDILGDEKLLKAVLAHEAVHWKRKHYFVLLLSYVVRAVYWFLPPVWICCGRALPEDMELKSDHQAMAVTDLSVREYESQIVKLIGSRSNLSLGLSFSKQFILKRFRYLDSGVRSLALNAAAAFLVLALFLAGLAGEHTYFYREDPYGFSRMDIQEAIRTVELFYAAVNARDREGVRQIMHENCATPFHLDAALDNYYEMIDIRYEPDNRVSSQISQMYQTQLDEPVLVLHSDNRCVSGDGSREFYQRCPYSMVKDENGHWKMLLQVH